MAKFLKSCRISITKTNSVVDYREYIIYLPEYLFLWIKFLLLLLLFSYAFYQHILFFLLLLPFSFFYPFLQRDKLRKKRQEVLVSQFKEMLSILSAYLSAGYSLENALFACIPDLENLLGKKCYMVEELKQIKRSLSMNHPLEEALSQFALRSGVDDIHNFSEIFLVAKRSGGDLIQIIQQSSTIIRDKLTITEEIITLNASRRFEQKIMNGVPFFMIFYLNASSPEFFRILYSSIMGRVVMSFCLCIYLLAIYLSQKIIAIPV